MMADFTTAYWVLEKGEWPDGLGGTHQAYRKAQTVFLGMTRVQYREEDSGGQNRAWEKAVFYGQDVHLPKGTRLKRVSDGREYRTLTAFQPLPRIMTGIAITKAEAVRG